MSLFKKQIQKALAKVDVQIDGKRPWDISVRDERLYRRVILRGSIGLGEAYMDGLVGLRRLTNFSTQFSAIRN